MAVFHQEDDHELPRRLVGKVGSWLPGGLGMVSILVVLLILLYASVAYVPAGNVHVQVHVKPECIEAFRAASVANARLSMQEPGIAQFDVLQQQDDPTRFLLIEVYRSVEATAAHKATAHYAAWRDAAEPLMAEPRYSVKYANVFPEDAGW